MSNEYPNSGGLWKTKEKKYEKSPDMWGEIKFDPEYLRELLDSSDGLVTVKLSAWKTESKAGNTYLYIKVDTWKPDGQKAASSDEKMPFDD